MRLADDDLPPDEEDEDDDPSDLRQAMLWRYILAEMERPQKIKDLCAEIVSEVPALATACQTWIEAGPDTAGISLADQLDVEASKAGHPLLREFADCVLALDWKFTARSTIGSPRCW